MILEKYERDSIFFYSNFVGDEAAVYFYTPGIYADGYIVFAFPFVCSFVSSFLRS